MSDKQRAQLAMMLRTGMIDQEDYNETIAAMDVRDAGRAPALTCPNCGRPVEADWRFCRVCGYRLQDSQTPYEEWLAQVDSKLIELGGFNLKHAKQMMPSLDIVRLFQDSESTPEETAQDILTIIERKA